MNISTNRNRLTDLEDTYVVASGEELETEISKCRLVYIRWMNSKVLLYSIEN